MHMAMAIYGYAYQACLTGGTFLRGICVNALAAAAADLCYGAPTHSRER
jgi:hypothetical protein